jgi:ferric-dicitrate binding protein FerR (iron transport regulator)
MEDTMKGKLLLVVFAVILGASVWAQEVKIMEIRGTGTVEYKVPGATIWLPVSKDTVLSKNASISTGFKSEVVLLVGKSTLTVRPLTRISIEELVAQEGKERATLNLQTGRIRASVPPAGGDINFTVRSPSATASVRGTVFEFDGVNLKVINSSVQLTNTSNGRTDGRTVVVDAGGSSFVDVVTGHVAAPAETAVAALTPSLPQGSESGVTPTVDKPANSNGDISLTITW